MFSSVRRRLPCVALALLVASLGAGAASASPADPAAEPRRWLAGDHHVHSHYSATYPVDPAAPDRRPEPVLGGDGPHTIVQNAAAAARFGLSWMVSTDHGGPNHSQLNHDLAWPELQQARAETPELIVFYGLELDAPGSEHASLIIPVHDGEREMLRRLESRWSVREPWPADPSRDTRAAMLQALREMDALDPRPVIIANHPSRSATAPGVWGEHDARSLRDWRDAAPRVAIGMEGAPGHQAASLKPDGRRGIYRRDPTMGGFDQMTATVGGLWDALLADGRPWWITATSDSHRHAGEGGDDFWPGEYSKTWVLARPDPADILDGLRAGRVFAVTGDLITGLDLAVEAGGRRAGLGETLEAASGARPRLTLAVTLPTRPNAAGRRPELRRIDVILGEVRDTPLPEAERGLDRNATARVIARLRPQDGRREGDRLVFSLDLPPLDGPAYVRVRGTSGEELEPLPDPPGEDPWDDLWFYANPVFLRPTS
jgi:hypothetical protein